MPKPGICYFCDAISVICLVIQRRNFRIIIINDWREGFHRIVELRESRLTYSENRAIRYIHSVLQGIRPTLKYWPHPLLPRSPKKFLIYQTPPPLWANPLFMILWVTPPPPLKILKNLTNPPLPSLPSLKCTLVHKMNDSFYKETKDFISNSK